MFPNEWQWIDRTFSIFECNWAFLKILFAFNISVSISRNSWWISLTIQWKTCVKQEIRSTDRNPKQMFCLFDIQHYINHKQKYVVGLNSTRLQVNTFKQWYLNCLFFPQPVPAIKFTTPSSIRHFIDAASTDFCLNHFHLMLATMSVSYFIYLTQMACSLWCILQEALLVHASLICKEVSLNVQMHCIDQLKFATAYQLLVEPD